MRARQIAVRLLAAKHEMLGARLVDRLADPLEADLQRVDGGRPVGLGDPAHEAGGHERGDHVVAGGERAETLAAGEHPVDEQGRKLVAREGLPLAAGSHGERCGRTEPVAVGVARHHEVVAAVLRLGNRPLEHRRIFWVGHVAGNVREITVGHLLRAVESQFLEAGAVEHRHDGARAHAVQRRVENGDIPWAGGGLPEHRRDEGRIDLLLHALHAAGRDARIEALAVHGVAPHHAVDDPLVVRWEHLHAACPVDLHGVVAGRIVTGRHHDAAGALRVANGV